MSSAEKLLVQAHARMPTKPADQLSNNAEYGEPSNAPISYNRYPLMANPAYAEGTLKLVKTFVAYRGKVCWVYEDPTTGEQHYFYGSASPEVI